MKYLIFFSLMIIFFVFCRPSPDKHRQAPIQDTISVRVFKVDTGGYGYDILINGKIFIHQDIVPAVAGYFTFSTYDKAYKTAKYVVEKMLRTKDLPGVTIRELDSLGVLDKRILEYQKQVGVDY